MSEVDSIEIVVNPYNSPDNANLKGAVISGKWKDDYIDQLRINGVEALYLNSSLGWDDDDFSFLCQLNWIKELDIIAGKARGLSSIENMTNLVYLSVTCETKDEVRFSSLSNLSTCYLYWNKGFVDVLKCKTLVSLYLDKVKLDAYDLMKNLSQLESLTISNSTIESLSWIEGFSNLTSLELASCKKIQSYSSLTHLENLKELSIRGGKIGHLDFLNGMSCVEVLVFSDCGDIGSLKPIEEIKALKAVAFAGNTNVLDGDLAYLETLPKLSMLMFKPRRHYSHRLIKKWSWKNLDIPDKLMDKK